MLGSFLTGFGTGLSLIMAIGAQNAFVLRQGVRRAHVGSVVAVCILSDALLICVGVAGFGALSEAAPWVADAMRWAGAAFLLGYGLLAFRSAWIGGGRLEAEGAGQGSRRAAVLTAMALTWLNPHVYLDTVVLLGTVAAQWEPRWAFGVGAVTASTVFFLSLGYGARTLAPVFARPGAWRVLDAGVGALMWTIAAALVFGSKG